MRRARQRGSVLIVALIVLVAVTLTALTLAREARVELQVASRAADDLRARALVDSAVERAIAVLKHDYVAKQTQPAGDTLLDLWRDDENDFHGAQLPGGRYWLVFGEPDPGDGKELRFGVRDEASKLNVNTATEAQLMALAGTASPPTTLMNQDVAEAILDWIDADEDTRPSGAESAYYNALSPPYSAKNGPIESIEELLRVKGIDEAMLYGEDRNRNGILDPGEDDGDRSFPPDDANGVLQRGLADYLTCTSQDLNVTLDGRKRLNALTCTPEQLRERLTTAGMSSGLVEQCVLLKTPRRGRPPLLTVGQFALVQGMDAPGLKLCFNELSNSDLARVPGLVNVNTAAREVLLGLGGGLTDDDVTAILTQRLRGGDLSMPAWLLGVITPAKLAQVYHLITARSWQFTIHAAVALDDHPSVIRRVEVLVDRSYAPVRVLWRRDLTSLGFPLPHERGDGNP